MPSIPAWQRTMSEMNKIACPNKVWPYTGWSPNVRHAQETIKRWSEEHHETRYLLSTRIRHRPRERGFQDGYRRPALQPTAPHRGTGHAERHRSLALQPTARHEEAEDRSARVDLSQRPRLEVRNAMTTDTFDHLFHLFGGWKSAPARRWDNVDEEHVLRLERN